MKQATAPINNEAPEAGYKPTCDTVVTPRRVISTEGFATCVQAHEARDASELTLLEGDVVRVALAAGGLCFSERAEGNAAQRRARALGL